MKRIQDIFTHPLYQEQLLLLMDAEKDRIFCRHTVEHFLDVARIGTIIALEEGLKINREWIYAAALLHDCGKHEQYENGIPHEQASARIAPEILKACGFNDEETGVIVTAISRHRDPEAAKEKNLNGILYRADKASRACFACDAEKDCNWKDGKKNLTIKY